MAKRAKRKWQATNKGIGLKNTRYRNGQCYVYHMNKYVLYCPQCHVHGKQPQHKKGCIETCFIHIPTTAEVPKANASRKTWRLFNERYEKLYKEILNKTLQNYNTYISWVKTTNTTNKA